jgi:hypothetical protein
MNTTKNNTEILLQAIKETGLEVNVNKPKYTSMSENESYQCLKV